MENSLPVRKMFIMQYSVFFVLQLLFSLLEIQFRNITKRLAALWKKNLSDSDCSMLQMLQNKIRKLRCIRNTLCMERHIFSDWMYMTSVTVMCQCRQEWYLHVSREFIFLKKILE